MNHQGEQIISKWFVGKNFTGAYALGSFVCVSRSLRRLRRNKWPGQAHPRCLEEFGVVYVHDPGMGGFKMRYVQVSSVGFLDDEDANKLEPS